MILVYDSVIQGDLVETLQDSIPSTSLSIPWEQGTETLQTDPNIWDLSLVQMKGMVKHLPPALLAPLNPAQRGPLSSRMGMCWRLSRAHHSLDPPPFPRGLQTQGPPAL